MSVNENDLPFLPEMFGFGTNLNPSPLSLRRVVIPTGSPDPCNKGGRDDLVQDAGAGSVAVGNTNRAYPSTDGIVYKRVGMGRLGQHQMNNTVNKNPCEIIEILDSWCLDLTFVVPPLSDGFVYAPPDDTDSPSARCDCNTPMYTLYSACAACQGAGWVNWSEWSAVCGVAHVGERPDAYLVTTPIPHWAFINVTVNDTFVPKAAKLVGGLPEQPMDGPTTTFTPTSFSTLSQMKPASSTSSPSSDLPSTTNTDAPKPKTPVGAIIGGSIGGLAAALCLIGLGLLLFYKRGGLKIPRIRKASGQISLFDSQGGRPDLATEEAAAVKRPLLYDPTNPTTFSQVHAELERPLHSGGGVQGSMGYYDPYRPSQPQSSSNDNNYRYTGIPQAH